MLLEAQTWIRANGPEGVNDLELISLNELQEIRRQWVVEKREIQDALPGIFETATGSKFPGGPIDDHLLMSSEDLRVLREIADDELHYQLVRDLLDVERRFQSMARRSGLFDEMEKVIRRSFYDDKADAESRARRISDLKRGLEVSSEPFVGPETDDLA